MKRALVIFCAALFVLSSCRSRGNDDPQAEPTTTATPDPTPCVLEDASNKPRSSEAADIVPLVEVRHNDDDGCPRVVFEFEGKVSGYDIGYVEPPLTDCGSGEEFDTSTWDASAFLRVRLAPVLLADDDGGSLYEGARDIPVGGDVLKHLKVICSFEGVFEWVVALDERHPLDVVTFDDPPRLVIDISQGR